nr:hypothetical protein [Escherichia coli]
MKNASAIRMLRQRLSSPFIQEFEMPGEELKRKQKIMNTVDVKNAFPHTLSGPEITAGPIC